MIPRPTRSRRRWLERPARRHLRRRLRHAVQPGDQPGQPRSCRDLYLSRGFAYVNSTELVNQQHCNQVLQGETLMMLKEHFIEGYGVPKWTVGTGGSGGSIQQLVITQMYPGLLDGLQPSLSFPDSSMQHGRLRSPAEFLAHGRRQEVERRRRRLRLKATAPARAARGSARFVPTMPATIRPRLRAQGREPALRSQEEPEGRALHRRRKCASTSMAAIPRRALPAGRTTMSACSTG